MNRNNYLKVVNRHRPKEDKIKNIVISFLVGGMMGLIGELLVQGLCLFYSFSRVDASTIMIIFFIFFAAFFTALGFFDKWVNICKCGLIIPITGFSHSMVSSALDYKAEGPIYGIGSNLFKLAGSVILYGVLSAWVFGMIRYLIGGVA